MAFLTSARRYIQFNGPIVRGGDACRIRAEVICFSSIFCRHRQMHFSRRGIFCCGSQLLVHFGALDIIGGIVNLRHDSSCPYSQYPARRLLRTSADCGSGGSGAMPDRWIPFCGLSRCGPSSARLNPPITRRCCPSSTYSDLRADRRAAPMVRRIKIAGVRARQCAPSKARLLRV